MLRLVSWFQKDLFIPPDSPRLATLEKALRELSREMRPAFTFDEEDDERCVVRFQGELWALYLFWDESFVPPEDTFHRLQKLGREKSLRLRNALIRRNWGDFWLCLEGRPEEGVYRLRIIRTWRTD